METHRWRHIKTTVADLLELERERWPVALVDRCDGDVDLFLDVARLMATTRDIGDFIERPIVLRSEA